MRCFSISAKAMNRQGTKNAKFFEKGVKVWEGLFFGADDLRLEECYMTVYSY